MRTVLLAVLTFGSMATAETRVCDQAINAELAALDMGRIDAPADSVRQEGGRYGNYAFTRTGDGQLVQATPFRSEIGQILIINRPQSAFGSTELRRVRLAPDCRVESVTVEIDNRDILDLNAAACEALATKEFDAERLCRFYSERFAR